MAANAIENFARWNLQIALLAIVATGSGSASAHPRSCSASRGLARHPRHLPRAASAAAMAFDDAVLARCRYSTARTHGSSRRRGRTIVCRWRGDTHDACHAVHEIELAGSGGNRTLGRNLPASGLARARHVSPAAHPPRGHQAGQERRTAPRSRSLIEAGAEIRRVDRLGQPVTFGILSPAVLLPESFARMRPGVQRAVLAHELWHVRRRDWMWVLIEEGIRAAFWFNPAMWWVISRVQSSREEVVDELTIQLTNNRQTYLRSASCVCRRADALSRDPVRAPARSVPPHVAHFPGGCDVVKKNHRVVRGHGISAAGHSVLRIAHVSAPDCRRCVVVSGRAAESAARSPARAGWPGNGPRA